MNHRSGVWAVEEAVPAPEPGGAALAHERADAERLERIEMGPPRSPVASPRPPPTASAPRFPQPAPVARTAEPERRIFREPTAPREPEEVLIVVSRLKDWVRDRSEFNTSADVFEVLSDLVRDATRDAIDHARSEGRKTIMARDFKR